MIKLLIKRLFLLFTSSTLIEAAEGIPDEALGSIYTEALWFIGIIAVMALISYIISSRNATRYEEEMAVKRAQQKERELEEAHKDQALLRDTETDNRIAVLSKLRDQGLLKDSEFTILKHHLLAESATPSL